MKISSRMTKFESPNMVTQKAIAAIVIGAKLLPLAAFALLIYVALNYFRGQMEKNNCASNLTQIFAACTAYANMNGGNYPDSVATLLKSTGYPPVVFICPASNDAPAALVPNNDSEFQGHCSYVYVGMGLTQSTAHFANGAGVRAAGQPPQQGHQRALWRQEGPICCPCRGREFGSADTNARET